MVQTTNELRYSFVSLVSTSSTTWRRLWTRRPPRSVDVRGGAPRQAIADARDRRPAPSVPVIRFWPRRTRPT